MNDEWSQVAANAVANAAYAVMTSGQEAFACLRDAALEQSRPSTVYRPRLSIDGNQWCALYGDNLQDGVAGFGDSPAMAMRDFDAEWLRKLPKEPQ